MKLFKMVCCVCFQNFRKWATNYRIWIIGLTVIIMTHYFTKNIGAFSRMIDIPVSPWIYPFLYNQRYIKLLFFFPLILLFCDAPFIDDNQPYVIFRSGRIPWSIGQIGYIFIATAIYFLTLILVSILINVHTMEFTTNWGKVLGTLANTDAPRLVELYIIVSQRTLYYFTPLQAMWFTFILSWLSGIFLGLLIYIINSVSGTRVLGVLSASFFLVLDATVVTVSPKLLWFSPISWSTLDQIDIGGMTPYPTIYFIYLAYGILITAMAVISITVNRRQTITVLPPV